MIPVFMVLPTREQRAAQVAAARERIAKAEQRRRDAKAERRERQLAAAAKRRKGRTS